ncbi:PRD domain-containing protein, partial [Clostridium saudiense]|nr:PRD domain-containing protein [Clostridium saudiense]
LTLTDHISFSIARQEKGLPFSNALLWEIKRFYPKEFKIGLKAVDLLNEEFNINLPDDEAASIAMHIVNAELGAGIRDTIQVTEVIQNVLNVIKYHFKRDLDEDSLYYSRF